MSFQLWRAGTSPIGISVFATRGSWGPISFTPNGVECPPISMSTVFPSQLSLIYQVEISLITKKKLLDSHVAANGEGNQSFTPKANKLSAFSPFVPRTSSQSQLPWSIHCVIALVSFISAPSSRKRYHLISDSVICQNRVLCFQIFSLERDYHSEGCRCRCWVPSQSRTLRRRPLLSRTNRDSPFSAI